MSDSRPDALINLAELQLLTAALEVERQIGDTKSVGPVLAMLAFARDDAVVSLAALVHVDAEKPDLVRKLQNDVNRYTDLLAWILKLNQEGWEVQREIEDGERELTRQYLNPNPDKPAQEEDDGTEHDA